MDEQRCHEVQRVGGDLLVLVVGAEVEAELEAEQLTQSALVRQILGKEVDKELVLSWLTFKALKDDVENAIGVKVEVANEGLDDFNDVSWCDSGQILNN